MPTTEAPTHTTPDGTIISAHQDRFTGKWYAGAVNADGIPQWMGPASHARSTTPEAALERGIKRFPTETTTETTTTSSDPKESTMTTTTTAPTPTAERIAQAKTMAGYRHAAVTRTTGTLVVLLAADEAGIDPTDGKWVTVCHDHGSTVSHQAQKPAQRHLHHPENWCDGCRDGQPTNDLAWTQDPTPAPRNVKVDRIDGTWTVLDRDTGEQLTTGKTRNEARQFAASYRS